MNMNFWPRVAVRQPSESKGQIYIPSINILLWVGCVLVVLHFQSSSNMEAAYGLAIIITMIATTILFANYLVLHRTKSVFINYYNLRFRKNPENEIPEINTSYID